MDPDREKGHSVMNVIGLSIAWCMFMFPGLYHGFNGSPHFAIYNVSNTILYFAGLLTTGIIVACLRRFGYIKRLPLLLGGLLFPLGNAITLMAIEMQLFSESLIYISAFIEGIGTTLLFLLWIHGTAEHSPDRFSKQLVLAVLIGSALLSLLMSLSKRSIVAWAIIIFILVVVSICFYVILEKYPSAKAKTIELGVVETFYAIPLPFELAVVAISFSFSLAFGLSNSSNIISLGDLGTIPVLLAGTITFILLRNPRSLESRLSVICKFAFPLIVFGMLLYLVQGNLNRSISNTFVLIGYFSFTLSSYLLFSSVAKHFKAPMFYVFAMGISVGYLGNFLGSFLHVSLSSFGGLSVEVVPGIEIADILVLSVIMILTVLGFFLFDEKKVSSIWGLKKNPEVASLSNQCVVLSNRYGLTERQTEVFQLLCEGKKPKQITEILVISDGTARAHIRSIYEKFDVHSYAELIEKVQSTQRA